MIKIFFLFHLPYLYLVGITQLNTRGRRGRDRMVVGFTTLLSVQSVHISTIVVSSIPTHVRCTRYNII
jgi:hypothetical protein